MKSIIFTSLLTYLHCYYFNIIHLKKYGSKIYIKNISGEMGNIVLDLSEFVIGDTIYLHFVYFNGRPYTSELNYDFSDIDSNRDYLNMYRNPYSESYGSMVTIYNYGIFRREETIYYYDYYYRITIPTYIPKTNFLVMRYDTTRNKNLVLNVLNTKYARYTLLIIAFSCFGFILLVIFILCLCKRRLKACYDRANPNQNNFGINNGQVSENALYPSSDNQEKLNEQNNEPEKEKIEIKDITDNNSQNNDDAPPQVDYYPTSE